MIKMNALSWICVVLILIGALNWGLVGIFSFDLVEAIFGEMSALSRIVYSVVGIAAIVFIAMLAIGSKKSEAGSPAHTGV